ncbi:MAG TPA: hypothetical protein VNY05_29730 [Candidatus Acidoferrales bacterium]|nr:hypothetical protein [Candidatus Acidoferrales bacterium]
MKDEIQARLLGETVELGDEEAGRRRNERLLRDPILGRFLRAKGTIRQESGERTPAP